MTKTTIEPDLQENGRGQIIWTTGCRECGSPSTERKEALFVSECLICNLPGCDLCMPKGSNVPCNECVKLLKEDPEYG